MASLVVTLQASLAIVEESISFGKNETNRIPTRLLCKRLIANCHAFLRHLPWYRPTWSVFYCKHNPFNVSACGYWAIAYSTCTYCSHTKGPFSGPALIIMSFTVEPRARAARRYPAQHTRNGFGHREATLTIWQCHICYVGHHREYNITNRHQQHRDPESRPNWNLRRPTAGDHWGLQQPQFDMGLCYD